MRNSKKEKARPISLPHDSVLNLENILCDTSPEVMKKFSHYLREEVRAAEERAVMRLAQEFRHKLPDSQQSLVFEAMKNMPAPVALAM